MISSLKHKNYDNKKGNEAELIIKFVNTTDAYYSLLTYITKDK